MSLVSVIMPTFNAEKWVSSAIDNLNAQTWPHIELIVVDDASGDGTVALMREKLKKDFKGPWKIIELSSNGGPSAARNLGAKAATGDWLQFLDSDDLLAPNKLERQMAVCAGAPADLVAVYSPWRRFYFENGGITWEGPLARTNMEGRHPIMCLVGGDRYLHNAGLVRRSVFEKIGGFDESLRFFECEEINVRIAQAGRLRNVPADEPSYLWRLHREKTYIGGDQARYRLAAVALLWIELLTKAADGRTLAELNLRAEDRKQVLDGSTMWLRRLYAKDRAAFHKYLDAARRLEPDIHPTYPGYAARLSRVLGYEKAEAAAQLGGMPRALAGKLLRGLGLRRQSSEFG